MKNGIAYPLAPEVIKAIEEKRKKFIKNIGVKISQARFTNIIAPGLKVSIENIRLNLKPTKVDRRKKLFRRR